MNNVFNAYRFGKLFSKHTVENYRNYLISVVVLCGMLSIFYYFFVLGIDVKNAGIRIVGLSMFYLLAGCIFTSSIFSDYGQKRNAITSLTLPASHFEKFLIGWIYSFLIFTIIYCLVYGVVDYTFLPFSRSVSKPSLLKLIDDQGFSFSMFLNYAFLHSIMIFGAMYFKSVHFVKTASVFFAFVMIICTFHYWLLKSLISQEVIFAIPLIRGVNFRNEFNRHHSILLEESQRSLYMGVFLIGTALAMWAATFYRFREKQV